MIEIEGGVRQKEKVYAEGIEFARLSSMDEILTGENDLDFLQEALAKYRTLYHVDKTLLQVFLTFAQFDNYERMYRTLLNVSFGREADIPELPDDIKPLSPKASRHVLALNETLERFDTVYVDDRTNTVLDLLSDDKQEELSAIDLLREDMRARREEIQLMEMQVKHLRRVPSFRPDCEGASENYEVVAGSEAGDGTSFSLNDWNVFWTKRFFSKKEHHLVPIPTDSRAETVQAVEEIGRGQLSISPSRVVGALEYYMRKDTYQKALSTRVSFAPESEREWVQIPRGKDRVMFVPDENTKQLVFFAARQDVLRRKA